MSSVSTASMSVIRTITRPPSRPCWLSSTPSTPENWPPTIRTRSPCSRSISDGEKQGTACSQAWAMRMNCVISSSGTQRQSVGASRFSPVGIRLQAGQALWNLRSCGKVPLMNMQLYSRGLRMRPRPLSRAVTSTNVGAKHSSRAAERALNSSAWAASCSQACRLDRSTVSTYQCGASSVRLQGFGSVADIPSPLRSLYKRLVLNRLCRLSRKLPKTSFLSVENSVA